MSGKPVDRSLGLQRAELPKLAVLKHNQLEVSLEEWIRMHAARKPEHIQSPWSLTVLTQAPGGLSADLKYFWDKVKGKQFQLTFHPQRLNMNGWRCIDQNNSLSNDCTEFIVTYNNLCTDLPIHAWNFKGFAAFEQEAGGAAAP